MTIVQKILAAGLLLISTTAFAATSYTYDELNRLTKVVYDDGRSISYSYDAAGNLLRIDRAAPVADPGTQLEDPFDGTALNPALWTAKGVNTCGGVVVGGGQAKFNGGTYANTEGNKAFAGDKIVVQALMAGKQSNRDTHFELVDTVTGDRLQFGDTSYQGQGLYFAGTGRYLVAQRSLQQASTPALRAYRLTAQANQVTLERGDSFDVPMSSTTITLPNSVAGRSFYLQIGTGGSDCYYSPGTFDWIKVSADSRLQPELTDDFNTIALDTNKWISAGYEFEPGLISRPAGSFSLHDGVLELFKL